MEFKSVRVTGRCYCGAIEYEAEYSDGEKINLHNGTLPWSISSVQRAQLWDARKAYEKTEVRDDD